MRALVVTSNPDTTMSDPGSPAGALSDLGCEVLTFGYDVDTLPEDIEVRRPSVVVVDAGAHLEVGRAAIRRMREVSSCADVPVLLCVEVSRLAAFDTEVGADDFVLVPFVAAELYARIRQLDWRMSSFRTPGRIKIDEPGDRRRGSGGLVQRARSQAAAPRVSTVAVLGRAPGAAL